MCFDAYNYFIVIYNETLYLQLRYVRTTKYYIYSTVFIVSFLELHLLSYPSTTLASVFLNIFQVLSSCVVQFYNYTILVHTTQFLICQDNFSATALRYFNLITRSV